MNPLLKLSHVSFSYHEADGETQALSDITFSPVSYTHLDVYKRQI